MQRRHSISSKGTRKLPLLLALSDVSAEYLAKNLADYLAEHLVQYLADDVAEFLAKYSGEYLAEYVSRKAGTPADGGVY